MSRNQREGWYYGRIAGKHVRSRRGCALRGRVSRREWDRWGGL